MSTVVKIMPYTNKLILSCVLLLIAFIIVVLMVSLSMNTIYGQMQTQKIGVNITSPERGKTVPINTTLTISGKSTDNPAVDDCQVAVIINNVKPYRPATANGSTGAPSDYSRWFFVLDSNYTSIKEGANEITAKLSCLPSNMTKWYSVNITGVASTRDTSAADAVARSQTSIPEQGEQQMTPSPSTPSPERLPTDDLFIQGSMQGGNEPDRIEGSLFADNIDGGNDDDRIQGNGGADTISESNGDDRIQGSGGDDTISGGNGDDYLYGNEDNDNLSGVNGDDALFGGEGDDILNGGNGDDIFRCGSGTDTIEDFSTSQGDVNSDDCENS